METLKKSDSIEIWVNHFIESTDTTLDNISQRERIRMALNSYYETQRDEEAPIMVPKDAKIKPRLTISKTVIGGAGRKGSVSLMGTGNVEEAVSIKEDLNIQRALTITNLALGSDNYDKVLIKSYVEQSYSTDTVFPSSIQIITESFETYSRTVILTEAQKVKVGDSGSVECIANFGACTVGDVYKGKWLQASFPDQLKLELDRLPRSTSHPIIFLNKDTNKVSISKQFKLQ